MIPDPFLRERSEADALVEGCFLLQRWRSARVPLPIRIWWGPPLDPDTGEEMDRSPRWQIAVGGVLLLDDQPVEISGATIVNLSDIWPQALSHPIERARYEYLIARADWAADYDVNDPYGSTSGRIDPMTASLPLFDGC